MNEKERKQLLNLLTSLNSEITVYHADGAQLYPEGDAKLTLSLLQQIGKDSMQVGKLLYKRSASRYPYIFCTNFQDESSFDLLLLLDRLLILMACDKEQVHSAQDAYSQILTQNEISNAQIKELAGAHALEVEKPYQVIHISFKEETLNAFATVSALYPEDTEDKLVPLSYKSLSIVHFIDEDSQFETSEFVEALYETIQEDCGRPCMIGISEAKKNLYELRRANAEAKKAIAISEKLENAEHTVFYGNLILERILLELSPAQRQSFYNRLFTSESKKALSEEMQNTINTFLDKDLNLSDTARHLFIHRNTLVYRLEKVQRTLGLDLKKFSDASIYKILSTMQKLTKTDKE